MVSEHLKKVNLEQFRLQRIGTKDSFSVRCPAGGLSNGGASFSRLFGW